MYVYEHDCLNVCENVYTSSNALSVCTVSVEKVERTYELSELTESFCLSVPGESIYYLHAYAHPDMKEHLNFVQWR